MRKTLDDKLAAIHADPSGAREFILCDAKDGDMGFGVPAPGELREPGGDESRFKSLAAYREQIRRIVEQGVVDIMLMSAGTAEKLVIEDRIFDESSVTPAARANDATDIHVMRGSRIRDWPSRPFRTASIDHIQCGHRNCSPEDRSIGCDLGLYSATFNNDRDCDLETLEHYKSFRDEAEEKGFRHFLEVFDPNRPDAVDPDILPHYVNDCIARMLAGVTSIQRPLFLKMAYHGPRAMEELVGFDPHLIVGILGGASGTTRDAFQLLHDARKFGARVALFGRKINNSEDQLLFIEFLRRIADGDIEPADAVDAYHAELVRRDIRPIRRLEHDRELETHQFD